MVIFRVGEVKDCRTCISERHQSQVNPWTTITREVIASVSYQFGQLVAGFVKVSARNAARRIDDDGEVDEILARGVSFPSSM